MICEEERKRKLSEAWARACQERKRRNLAEAREAAELEMAAGLAEQKWDHCLCLMHAFIAEERGLPRLRLLCCFADLACLVAEDLSLPLSTDLWTEEEKSLHCEKLQRRAKMAARGLPYKAGKSN